MPSLVAPETTRHVHGRHRLPSPTSGASVALGIILFGIAYLLLAGFEDAFRRPESAALFWPTSGLYLSVLLIHPRHRWPIFIGTAMALSLISDVFLHGQSWGAAVGFSMASSVEAALGAYLVLRFRTGDDDDFARLGDTLRFILSAACIATSVGAVIGAVTVHTFYPAASFPSAWWDWWRGDVLSVLLIAPMVLGCIKLKRKAPQLNWLRTVELLLLLGTCAIISCYVFLGLEFRVVALLVPPLLYAALRFEAAGVACATTVCAMVALYALAWQLGPFRYSTHAAEELFMMQIRTSVLLTSLLVLATVMSERNAYRLALEEANRQLELLAGTDGLTRVWNRRQFDLHLQEEFVRARRSHDAFSLLLIDVDHFKQYNDRFGHPAGDKVLKQVAKLLQQQARSTDLVARYGGEEFAILLPATDKQGAVTAAERCRLALQEGVQAQAPITVSIGISTLGAAARDLKTLVDAADQALYLSKRRGRNRWMHADDLSATAV